jgi:hypothetical protein
MEHYTDYGFSLAIAIKWAQNFAQFSKSVAHGMKLLKNKTINPVIPLPDGFRKKELQQN